MNAKDIESAINEYIRPQSFPVGARFCAGPDDFPAKTKRPKRDLGFQVAICQSVGIARRYGWLLGIAEEDLSCPFAMIAFGYARETPKLNAGEYCAGLYTATPEAGARSEAAVPRLDYSPTRALLLGPLARWEGRLDVVVVYGNSAQVMRLAQAALYHDGGAIESFTTGRIDCSEILIRGARQANVVLPCTGDRLFGLTADDEMAFGFPASQAEAIVEGLRETHRSGIRYPTTTFLRFQAQFPDKYNELMAELRPNES